MAVRCTETFYKEINKLKKNNSYRSIETDIFDYLFNSSIDTIKMGSSRLNGSNESPFIKKRIDGSGGYRLYLLVQINKEDILLSFLHPKTGSLGFENINDAYKLAIYKDAVSSLKNNNYYVITYEDEIVNYALTTAKV
jgi:hypothetical protein